MTSEEIADHIDRIVFSRRWAWKYQSKTATIGVAVRRAGRDFAEQKLVDLPSLTKLQKKSDCKQLFGSVATAWERGNWLQILAEGDDGYDELVEEFKTAEVKALLKGGKKP